MYVIRETTHGYYLVGVSEKTRLVIYRPDKEQAIRLSLGEAAKVVDILNEKYGNTHTIEAM